MVLLYLEAATALRGEEGEERRQERQGDDDRRASSDVHEEDEGREESSDGEHEIGDQDESPSSALLVELVGRLDGRDRRRRVFSSSSEAGESSSGSHDPEHGVERSSGGDGL